MPLDRSTYDFSNVDLPVSDAFKTLAAKSTKPNKKTGVVPQQTALDKILKSAQTSVDKNSQKIRTNAIDNQNAVDKVTFAADQKARAAADTTPAEASKQQSKEWDAYAQGVKTGQVKGTLPPGFGPATVPDVGVADVKLADVSQPDTAGASISQSVIDAANAEYQRTGQMPALTTDKVHKLQAQIDEQKAKIETAKSQGPGGGSFNPFSPGDWVDAAANAGSIGLEGLGKAVDIASRPGYAAIGGIDAGVNNMKNYGDAVLHQQTLTPQMDQVPNQPSDTGDAILKGMWGGLSGTNVVTGQKLLEDIGAPNIPVVTPVAGWAAETLLDPTTYASFGIANAAKSALGVSVREGIDIENSVLRAAAKAGTQKTATVAVSKAAESEAKKTVAKIAKAGGAIGGPVTEHEDMANNLFAKAIAGGATMPDALASIRHTIEQKILSEAADQKYATAMLNAARDNKRIVDVKLLGHSTNIGKNPLIDLPYQAIRKAKGKLVASDVGQALAGAFSTKYWFPGETHTLFDKANSMGVGEFTNQFHEVRDQFKGLTKAEKRRIADTTEKGIPLAGDFAKNGKDLGEVQKFFKETTDKLFAERQNILGKAGPHVDDYVFHHYTAKSPAKIKAVAAARKARLEAGATGADRLTLDEAEKLGMKPYREADKILVAHAADHQRQMVRESFHRMMTNNYAHWTDNPLTAQKLGLTAVTPPKSAIAKKGMKMYMTPEVKKVYDSVGKFMGRNEEESAAILRHFDQVMRGWKMANTTLRPGHHVRNMIGDMYLNFLDGVTNPHRYSQGLRMVAGDRTKLRIRVGNQTLNGDDILNLWHKSGANSGFISSEFMEGRNPLLKGLNEFSQGREMSGRYAHFIDVLQKEGKKANLGANNRVGLYKIATDAGRRVNKWNINYQDLTPFEKSYMKRAIPFYTWTRKAVPLMLESIATRPGRVTQTTKLNHLISNLAGQDPTDMHDVPYPEWLKEVGFAKISDGPEPNVWSVPLPSQDVGRWFGGGTPDSVAKQLLSNINPFAQMLIERGTGKNLYTGAQLPQDTGSYVEGKFGIAQNIGDMLGMGKDPASTVKAINALTGVGLYKDTEQRQLSELRRQQTPLQVDVSNINKNLGDFEVHKLKYGYSVYNKHFKMTEKSGFSTPEDALIYAIGLNKKATGK